MGIFIDRRSYVRRRRNLSIIRVAARSRRTGRASGTPK